MKPNLREAILEVAHSYGQVTIRAGIVYVELPDGELWDFTTPLINKYGIPVEEHIHYGEPRR